MYSVSNYVYVLFVTILLMNISSLDPDIYV